MKNIKDLTKNILVLDIGGTYVKYAIMDNHNKIHFKDKMPNVMKNDFNGFCSDLQKLFVNNEKKYKITGIAISSLGVINKNNKQIFWVNKKIYKYQKIDFKEIFNNLPIYVENDVNCAMIGEVKFGDLKKINDGFMITLGTGIGGAILINKHLYKGTSNFAGEVGSLLINEKRWEDIASVSALIKQVGNILNKEISINEIFELAITNYKVRKCLDTWYKSIALGIVNICYTLNPKKFIIGGGIVANKNFNLKKIKHFVKAITLNNYYLIDEYTIQIAKLGNDAALYGACALYFENIHWK